MGRSQALSEPVFVVVMMVVMVKDARRRVCAC